MDRVLEAKTKNIYEESNSQNGPRSKTLGVNPQCLHWRLPAASRAAPVIATPKARAKHIDDKAESSRVRSALSKDTQYKYDDVNVQTFKGVVQLSGFVNSRDQKNRAGDLARKVEGVREVENNITVKESAN